MYSVIQCSNYFLHNAVACDTVTHTVNHTESLTMNVTLSCSPSAPSPCSSPSLCSPSFSSSPSLCCSPSSVLLLLCLVFLLVVWGQFFALRADASELKRALIAYENGEKNAIVVKEDEGAEGAEGGGKGKGSRIEVGGVAPDLFFNRGNVHKYLQVRERPSTFIIELLNFHIEFLCIQYRATYYDHYDPTCTHCGD